MIRKLAHLCLVTDRLEEMRAFYVERVGLPVLFEFRLDDGRLFGFYLTCGENSFIEIFDRVLKHEKWGRGGALVPLVPGNRIDHLCLEVTGLAEFVQELKGRGVVVSAVKMEMDHSYQAWTKDPDGNSIEFMEYTHASWQLRAEEARK